MAYAPDPKAMFVLRNPLAVAIAVGSIGVLGGALEEQLFNNALFARFGSITVGFGALLFGIAASELLTRSQYSFIMDSDGEPGEPFGSRTVRFALACQASLVLFGTLQWGFGDLVFSVECIKC